MLVASAVMLPIGPITGAVVSRTVMVKVFRLVLLAASRAVQVTVVMPIANVPPDAGRQATVAPTASVTVGVV